jgi:hypothetical protein
MTFYETIKIRGEIGLVLDYLLEVGGAVDYGE